MHSLVSQKFLARRILSSPECKFLKIKTIIRHNSKCRILKSWNQCLDRKVSYLRERSRNLQSNQQIRYVPAARIALEHASDESSGQWTNSGRNVVFVALDFAISVFK